MLIVNIARMVQSILTKPAANVFLCKTHVFTKQPTSALGKCGINYPVS